jgi:hypothetical protein
VSVHIGTMTSEVVAEPEAHGPEAAETMPAPERWRELDRARAAQAALARLNRRTSAEGFDD